MRIVFVCIERERIFILHGWRENLAGIQEIWEGYEKKTAEISETPCTWEKERERECVGFRFDEDMHSSDRLWDTCFTSKGYRSTRTVDLHIRNGGQHKDAFPFRVTFILTPSWRDLYTWSRVKYKLLGIIIVTRSEQETRFERAWPLNWFLLFVPWMEEFWRSVSYL